MKNILVLISFMAFSLCGCANKIEDLRGPEKEKTIVLETNMIAIQKENYVAGILAGSYKLIGTHKNGEYYLGERPVILNLVGSDALEFLQKGTIAPGAYTSFQYPRGISNGGLLILNEGGIKTLKVFFLDDPITSPTLGPVANLISESVKGGINMYHLGNEELILKAIEQQLN